MFERRQDDSTSEIEAAQESATSENIRIVQHVTIGKTIKIKGVVTGSEDLLIEGTVEGTIDLPDHNLTIGQAGHVMADVTAKTIEVEGKVNGDIRASQNVCVTETARMVGNIKAPRVSLEDGAEFKGSIDMHAEGEKRVVAAAPMPINRD